MEETVLTAVRNLHEGDVIVGEEGGRSYVKDAGPSSRIPGCYSIETEHGTLEMDPDFEVFILA